MSVVDASLAFRETQGPAHAFARCAGLAIESEAFLSVCVDEWAKLGAAASPRFVCDILRGRAQAPSRVPAARL